jgi:UPF0755 protein
MVAIPSVSLPHTWRKSDAGFIAGLLLVLLAISVLAGATYLYVERWAQAPMPLARSELIELKPGQAFSNFAATLADRDIMDQPELWSWYARLTGQARLVQAGEYQLLPGETPQSLLQRLRLGDVANYEVQLIEGWTVRQALGALSAHPELKHTLESVDEHTLLSVLGLPPGHAEGMFFPDTYHFERGASDSDILRRAYTKLQQELAAGWQTRAAGLPYGSPYEALIVGSLVEKETGRDSDRETISQVFVTRLQKRMRLQTDPSVIYGVGSEFRGDLTRRHLRTDTPYNTYTRHGLPPSPIALVGSRSLEAAFHPAEGEFLYFVSRGDGSSQFSISLEEHNAAVRRYQLQ